MSSFLCLVIFPKYFVIDCIKLPCRAGNPPVRMFPFHCPSPCTHYSHRLFNRVPVIDAFVKAYAYGLYQRVLVISGNYAQDHLRIIPVVTFFSSFSDYPSTWLPPCCRTHEKGCVRLFSLRRFSVSCGSRHKRSFPSGYRAHAGR